MTEVSPHNNTRVQKSAAHRQPLRRRDSTKLSAAAIDASKSHNLKTVFSSKISAKLAAYREEGIPYADAVQAVWFSAIIFVTSPMMFGVNALTFFLSLTATWFSVVSLSAFGDKNGVDGAKRHKIPLAGERQPDHNMNAKPVFVPAKLKRESSSEIGFPSMTFSDKTVANIIMTRFTPADLIGVAVLPIIVHLIVQSIETATYGLTGAGAFTAMFLNYLWLNTIHWYGHVKPDPAAVAAQKAARDDNQNLYIQRTMKVKAHPHREGVKCWTMPSGSSDWFINRGMTHTGIPYIPYMFDLLTWAVEYKFRAIGRMISYDINYRFGKRKPVSAENTFNGIMNTSLACYVNADKKEFASYDCRLPWNTQDLKFFHKITVQMDFETRRVGRMELWPVTQEDTVEVIVVDSVAEIDAILYIIYMFKTHPMVHNMAAAITDVCPVTEWASAETSHILTEGFNAGAVHSSADTLGHQVTPFWLGSLIGSNCTAEGIPMHADLTEDVVGSSILHEISQACRKALSEVIPDVHRIKREAIISASVMHAADHWYCDRYMSGHSCSEVLNSSGLIVRACLQKPMKIRCRNVMMKDRIHADPVCAALYEACAAIDREFADEALSVGILV